MKNTDGTLEKEVVFFKGPPSASECLVPFLTSFVLVGIIPLFAALNRQLRVRYLITDRRVKVTTDWAWAGRIGWDGKDVIEFSYQEIAKMQVGVRDFGYSGDLVIYLRDGARVEMF